MSRFLEASASFADAHPAASPAQRSPAQRSPARTADDAVGEAADVLDRSFRAGIARATLGLSPAALGEAYLDWFAHLATSPGKQLWLAWKGSRKALRYGSYLAQCAENQGQAGPCIEPLPGDRRFADPAWQTWPFNVFHQGFLLWQQWLHNATTDVRGVSAAHERVVSFVSRQILDTIAPSNFPLTNPLVVSRTVAEGGANLVRGFSHVTEDIAHFAGIAPGAAAQRIRLWAGPLQSRRERSSSATGSSS